MLAAAGASICSWQRCGVPLGSSPFLLHRRRIILFSNTIGLCPKEPSPDVLPSLTDIGTSELISPTTYAAVQSFSSRSTTVPGDCRVSFHRTNVDRLLSHSKEVNKTQQERQKTLEAHDYVSDGPDGLVRYSRKLMHRGID